MKSIRIVTLNAWSEGQDFEKRWPYLAGELAALNPDVVGLEEVFRIEKAKLLQKVLGFPTLVYREREGGLALLSGEKRLNSGFLRYETKSPNEDYFRYALWARLEIAKKSWDFFITHLSWRVEDSVVRQHQIGELWDWIEEKNQAKHPCVLMGDMNAAPDSEEMKFLSGGEWLYLSKEGSARVIKAHEPFSDTFAKIYGATEADAPRSYTWSYKNPYTHRTDLPERRIDYIWYRPAKSGENYKITSSSICLNVPKEKRMFPSDHFGVVTDFRLD